MVNKYEYITLKHHREAVWTLLLHAASTL